MLSGTDTRHSARALAQVSMGRLCETLKGSARLGDVPAFLLKVRGKNKSQKFAQEYHRVKNLRIMNPGYNPHYFYWPQPPCLFWLGASTCAQPAGIRAFLRPGRLK